MARLSRVFVLLLLTLWLAFPTNARADDLTSIIQRHYTQMTSFSADFTQTLKHKESGSVEKRKGTLLFAKPLRINWETKSPHAERLIITKDAIWNYIPDESICYRYHPNIMKGATSIVQVITGQADLMRDFEVKRINLENNLQHLKLYPKNPTTQLVEADIWVEPDSGIIKKSVSLDFYGNTNTITFTRYTENIAVRDAAFKFSPPKGVEVEDRRKNTEQKDLFR